MVQLSKEIGNTIRLVERALLLTRPVTRTMANGQTTKQISLESTRQKTVLDTKAFGETTNNMVMVLKISLAELGMKEST